MLARILYHLLRIFHSLATILYNLSSILYLLVWIRYPPMIFHSLARIPYSLVGVLYALLRIVHRPARIADWQAAVRLGRRTGRVPPSHVPPLHLRRLTGVPQPLAGVSRGCISRPRVVCGILSPLHWRVSLLHLTGEVSPLSDQVPPRSAVLATRDGRSFRCAAGPLVGMVVMRRLKLMLGRGPQSRVGSAGCRRYLLSQPAVVGLEADHRRQSPGERSAAGRH